MSKRNLLIKGLFASPEVQLANISGWNDRLRWGFTEADFEAIRRRQRTSQDTDRRRSAV
jgi:hypothetical protein